MGVIRSGELVAVERIETLRQRAGQTMTVEFGAGDPGAAGDRPADLDVLRQIPGVVDLAVTTDGASAGPGLGAVTFTIRGSANPLIRTLARYDVVRLSAAEAPLEDVFLQFYETPATQTAASPARADGRPV